MMSTIEGNRKHIVAASAALAMTFGGDTTAGAQMLQGQSGGGGGTAAIGGAFQGSTNPPDDTPLTVPSTPGITGSLPDFGGRGGQTSGGGEPAQPVSGFQDDPAPGSDTGRPQATALENGRGGGGGGVIVQRTQPAAQRSTWQLCNGTGGGPISVAIGHPQGNDWLSRGWINLPDGTCRTILEDSDLPRVYYFAMSARRTYQGQAAFCIRRGAGFAHAGRVCRDGHQTVRFRAVTLDRAAVRTTVR